MALDIVAYAGQRENWPTTLKVGETVAVGVVTVVEALKIFGALMSLHLMGIVGSVVSGAILLVVIHIIFMLWAAGKYINKHSKENP